MPFPFEPVCVCAGARWFFGFRCLSKTIRHRQTGMAHSGNRLVASDSGTKATVGERRLCGTVKARATEVSCRPPHSAAKASAIQMPHRVSYEGLGCGKEKLAIQHNDMRPAKSCESVNSRNEVRTSNATWKRCTVPPTCETPGQEHCSTNAEAFLHNP